MLRGYTRIIYKRVNRAELGSKFITGHRAFFKIGNVSLCPFNNMSSGTEGSDLLLNLDLIKIHQCDTSAFLAIQLRNSCADATSRACNQNHSV
ncbi:hypothetical protein AYJ70_18385 [Pseudomonas monteilii]|uniref:Uncharacterized protein n=1 Tax=Pseudomonas monteilii TaxID=76759 RepID=A0AAP7FS54_9PSED|nr:hypothetical protein AYJ70_18385 [Pseudomonas monteilii]